MQLCAIIFITGVCLLQACATVITTTPQCPINCKNGGTCIMLTHDQGPKCVCPPQYSGPFCETHQCQKFCKDKGMCYLETSLDAAQCNCSTSCNTCDGRCFNGGTCHSSKLGQPQCICKPGFTGIRCQDCTNLECKNDGICSNNETNKESCKCAAGYHGRSCEKSDCDDFCLSGGTCILNPTGPISTKQPTCACPPLYSGRRCEVNLCLEPNPPVDKCKSINACGCLNNGTCEDLSGGKICKCTDIWGGDKCQHYLGHGNPCVNWCHNDGICAMKNARGYPSCICSDGWTGEQCDQPLNCQFYCHNGGSCSIRNGAPACLCPSGFKGNKCHQPDNGDVVAESTSHSSVVFSALLAFGISILVLCLFGAIYYILRRRHTFFHVRLLENDFSNPMFQDREME